MTSIRVGGHGNPFLRDECHGPVRRQGIESTMPPGFFHLYGVHVKVGNLRSERRIVEMTPCGESDGIDYLPPRPWRQLRAFITQAAPPALRRQDWLAFYQFVRSCHAHQALLSRESLLGFLRDNGFSDESATELGAVYLHGRGLLAADVLAEEPSIG